MSSKPVVCGQAGEHDAEQELACSHIGFAVSGRGIAEVVEAVRRFQPKPAFEAAVDKIHGHA